MRQRNRWSGLARVAVLMFAALAGVLSLSGRALAQAPADSPGVATVAGSSTQTVAIVCWSIAFIGAMTALVQARKFYVTMIAADPGSERNQEIAGFVQQGANAYLQQQYRVVAVFFVVVALLLAWAAFGLKVQSEFVPFAFLTGGFFSGLAGWFGMKTATAASNRTAAAAEKSLNQGLQVAFRSGAVMGLTVVGLGLTDICLWFAFLYWVWPALGMAPLSISEISVTMVCFGMGASAQALFARVGGGIFTKAADVGADLVGKVEQGIPEDDPRNPATIADNVGDNVGDVAGMGADLYESYAGSILAASALGAAAFVDPSLSPADWTTDNAQIAAMMLPMVIAGLGIFVSIFGIYLVKTDDDVSQKSLLQALDKGISRATYLVIAAAIAAAYFLMPSTAQTTFFGIPGVAFSVVFGAAAGIVIGKWTEYCTSDEYSPTKKLADQAVTGPATIIISGIANGMMSVWLPVITVCVATILSFGCATGGQFTDVNIFSLGLYGVGVAAVGMLSTLGITLATDAYGPIADNAGGNAEMAGMPAYVRERTDALDSLGNTTAATGKGFAIGSAALTALALLAAYIEGVRVGFDRWGKDFAETTFAAQGADAFQSGWYKLSDRFVVNIQQDSADGASAGKPKVSPFLIMPSQLRGSDLVDRWIAMPVESRLPASSSEIEVGYGDLIDIPTGDGEGGVVWKPSNTELTPLSAMTLPDFNIYFDATLMNPKVLIGLFAGAMATFVFCAMTLKAVGRAAQGMVEEVRRQFLEKPGIMTGDDMPDYERPVAISTMAAQAEMIGPSLLGILLPVGVGMVLGVAGVLGLLIGTLVCGFCVAVFMANSGGSWDNAKKYIEAGAHGGKGTATHKAAVVGDMVGDPFKDTSGPSLNILIKLMSMVSVVMAGLIVRYSLASLGWF
ncbi:sodium-translocating pyrophosphatase [Botrimarina mediterranea]|uniref:Putative K(+)-stimulated pyrophosphate-energized sodium pump n=1 Tax=Botrimarina mediterranea TaxID=2528022 RepID=A0A518K5S2_9BACT|nr:sodium-translocating pyrophosphatase [Botrimarina mediterranea]QDV73142.1 Putative K(+)-stimulated pyrophosphate-energized sodium pump [Botrimarina mediterranea]QDV77715.1 Putative K(+)-stimulated pyrophosphate-energized sodium pump [Planctomycetes bacterium K2D]